MKSSSIGYFRLEQIRELFSLLQIEIVYLCLLIMNMAVFFNNFTIANILYNEGTFLRWHIDIPALRCVGSRSKYASSCGTTDTCLSIFTVLLDPHQYVFWNILKKPLNLQPLKFQ
jgi:hypothetical protein